MSDFPTLETDRLLLRELVADDAPALFAIHGDAPAMRWYGADPMVDVRQAQRLIEIFAGWRQMPNPGVRWGIERKSDASLVGTCGLFKWNRGWRTCTVGYELARAARGAGLMAEALSAALGVGFRRDAAQPDRSADSSGQRRVAQTGAWTRLRSGGTGA